MGMQKYVPCLLLIFHQLSLHACGTDSPDKNKGHLKPFGEQGVNLNIEERPDFPEPFDFMTNYLQKSKPVKFAGVFKDAPCVQKWTDSYLLSLDVPADSVVHLETVKKEVRTQETEFMNFHDFLRIYNNTEHYMVDSMPPYLQPEVLMPCSLQCKELLEYGLAENMMWFSSGGTKSVIHTDAYENINCVLRGEKMFILADPARDRTKFALNVRGGYSEIDVDSVDLNKYPEIADVEFYRITMKPGDCLYIPFKWIHQVRSFNSNVAINLWWDHFFSLKLLEEREEACQGHCDPSLTMAQVTLNHLSPQSVADVRDFLEEIVVEHGTLTLDEFIHAVLQDDDDEVKMEILTEIFLHVDGNKDVIFSKEDTKLVDDKTWEVVGGLFEELDSLEHEEAEDEAAQRREYAEYVAAERRQERGQEL